MEDCLHHKYNSKPQKEQKKRIGVCDCFYIRLQELQLGTQALRQQKHSDLVRSASLPIHLSQSSPLSPQHRCDATSPLYSSPQIKSPFSFPAYSPSSSDEELASHISPSPPPFPRQKQLSVSRAGVPISPLAIKRKHHSPVTSAIINYQCRSKSMPQDLNLSSWNYLQDNTAQVLSKHKSVEQISSDKVKNTGDNTVYVHAIQTKGAPSERWASVIHRRSEPWNRRDEQSLEVSMTELHRQSLNNPNSMANVTKVSTS